MAKASKTAAKADNSVSDVASESDGTYKPNATFKTSPNPARYEAWRVMDYVHTKYNQWKDTPDRYKRYSVYLNGAHGIAKTGFTKGYWESKGIRFVYKSLPTCEPSNFFVPMPNLEKDSNGVEMAVLRKLLLEELRSQGPDDAVVFMFDETNRVTHPGVMSMLMEITQEFTMAEQTMAHLITVVCAGNPPGKDYAGLTRFDPAQASRFITVDMDTRSTPWQHFLAQKYSTLDLTNFFRKWNSLESSVRDNLPPRVLEHIIDTALEGLPVVWTLPVIKERQKLENSNGEDVTVKVLTLLVEALGARYVRPSDDPELLQSAIKASVKHGWNLRIIGPHGYGKTSTVKASVKEMGLREVYKSMAYSTPEDDSVPCPVKDDAGGMSLEFLTSQSLLESDKYVLILDEYSRVSRRMASQAMELTGSHSLNGVPLTNLCAVVAIDNPPKSGGLNYDAGRIDMAQATRFHLTIELGFHGTPWRKFLEEKYGEVAQPFCSWWSDDLSTADGSARHWATPRQLEMMIDLYEEGLDMKLAIPMIDGKRVALLSALPLLEKRLSGRLSGLSSLIANCDAILTEFRDPELSQDRDIELRLIIQSTLSTADIVELAKYPEEIAHLFHYLDKHERLMVTQNNNDKSAEFKAFWRKVIPLHNSYYVTKKNQK